MHSTLPSNIERKVKTTGSPKMNIEQTRQAIEDDSFRFFKHNNVSVRLEELDTKRYILSINLGKGKRKKGVAATLTVEKEFVGQGSQLLMQTIKDWLVIYAIDAIEQNKKVELSKPLVYEIASKSEDDTKNIKIQALNEQNKASIKLLNDYNLFKDTAYVS